MRKEFIQYQNAPIGFGQYIITEEDGYILSYVGTKGDISYYIEEIEEEDIDSGEIISLYRTKGNGVYDIWSEYREG